MGDSFKDLPILAEIGEALEHGFAREQARSPRRAQRRPRAPRLALAIGAVIAIFVAAGLGVALRGGSPDVAARAYAASIGPGVIHWRTEVSSSLDGRPSGQRLVVEGWSAGARKHVVVYELRGRRLYLWLDELTTGARTRTWSAETNDYSNETVPPAAQNALLSLTQDPFAAFRTAYTAKRLHRVSSDRYALTLSTQPPLRLEYRLDPETARPLRLVITSDTPAGPGRSAHHNVSVYRFATYARLRASTVEKSNLALLPHPGAGPSRLNAAQYFAALRNGTPVHGRRGRQLARIAHDLGRFHVDVPDIRRLGKGAWLLPGRGYLCLAVALPRHATIGTTCSTIGQAIKNGLGAGFSGRSLLVAVPDGVQSLRAHLPGHPPRLFPVHRGLARLPSLGYRLTLER